MCIECGPPQFQILDLLSVFLALGCYLPLFVAADFMWMMRKWID